MIRSTPFQNFYPLFAGKQSHVGAGVQRLLCEQIYTDGIRIRTEALFALPTLPPNSGLIIRIIVLIPRQSFASPRSFRSRESITLYTCELPPPGWSPWVLPLSSLSSTATLICISARFRHYRFVLGLFHVLPPPPPDLTIPRGNYVATGKPSGICIERISFPRVARALCVEPNESRGYFC